MKRVLFYCVSTISFAVLCTSCFEVHNDNEQVTETQATPIDEGYYPPSDSFITDRDTTVLSEQKVSYAPTHYSGAPRELRTQLVEFAKKYIGTKYAYACSLPEQGFDCSGFINYVFNHFKIKVPRSSKDFEFAGKEVPITNMKKGDLVLFTGTDPQSTEIGHIGIITEPAGMASKFIHSSSGSANGVTISSLDEAHYTRRFVKVVDVIQ